jgi:FAD:protein FMN transferase
VRAGRIPVLGRPVTGGFLSGCLLLLSLAVCDPAAPLAASPAPLFRHEGTRLSMACVYSIVAYGPDARTLPFTVEAALDEIDRVDRLMSHYRPESPLSRLNREAGDGPVTVEPELLDFLAECMKYSRESDGAFDVTVGPLMKAWGFFRGEGRMPSEGELAEVRGRIGYAHVTLRAGERTIQFDRPGVELDLGGIGKGYAVDRAVSVLRSHGIAAALVSAGGSTIYGLGAPPGRRGWEVTIQDPLHANKTARKTVLRDRALSVSGSYDKSFEVAGVSYGHIMDPRTGRPVTEVLGVAVLAGSGTAGDALDDAFFVLGVEKSREYLKRLPPTEALLFLPDGGRGWRLVDLRN